MSNYRLPLVIELLEEGGYLATSPVFPGLLVQADTVEEALALAPGVARALIEAMREKGVPLPSAKALLSPEKIERRGYFNAPAVQTILNHHLSGKADLSARLWSLIVFEVWNTLYVDKVMTSRPSSSLSEIMGFL